MNTHRRLRTPALLTAALLSTSAAMAGGYKIPDQSTRALGMMDAFVAGADDASAVYYNPAGLAHLTSPELIGNLYLSHTELDWDSQAFADEESDNKHYLIPTVYGAYPVPDRDDLVLGLGIYSPYGLGTEWDPNDSPNNAAVSSLGEIVVVNLTPSIAWRATDRLRLGGGLDFAWSSVEQRWEGGAPPLPPRTSLDGHGTGVGYNLGLQYDFTPACTLGLTYRSKMEVDYSGDAKIGAPRSYSGRAETEIEFPASATIALSVDASPCLRLEAVAEWDDWSVNERTLIYGAGGQLLYNIPNNWDPSWVFMLGAEYDATERMTLRAGYGYNEQPIPPEYGTPSLPQDNLHAVSLGMGYQMSDRWTLDTAVLVSRSEDEQRISQSPVLRSGEYSHFGYALSVGVRYVF